ncbi:MAG: CapA family protein [Chitinophagales bacterium]
MTKKVLAGILIALILCLSGCQPKTEPSKSNTRPKTIKPDKEVSLTAVGDVMLARHVGELMLTKGDNYPFQKITPTLKSADITIGNLESPISDRGTAMPGKGICFRARPEAGEAVRSAGFDVLSIANNHSLDYDNLAFLDTMFILRDLGMKTVGGGRNISEARQPVIITKDGLKVGILAYTIFADLFYSYSYQRSFEATEEQSGVAPLNKEIVLEDLAKLKPQVDITIVSLHWGTEYNEEPDQQQRVLAKELVDGGADLIIGHHPHIVQGVERYKNGLIAYSLGNFIFDQNQHVYTRQGFILKAILTPQGAKKIQLLPVFIDHSQPRLMKGEEAESFLEQVKMETEELGTGADIQNNSLVITEEKTTAEQ